MSNCDPLQQLIDDYYTRIWRVARKLCGNEPEADEIAQETFLVAIDRWGTFQRRSETSTWLIGICIRVHRSRTRRAMRGMRRAATWLAGRSERQPADNHAVEEREQSTILWATVQKLPRPQAEAIVLRFADELSVSQIARTLGVAEGTVKSRIHYGCRTLQKWMDTEDQSHGMQMATISQAIRSPSDATVPRPLIESDS